MQDSITHEALEALGVAAQELRAAAPWFRSHESADMIRAANHCEQVAKRIRTGQLIHAVPSEPWGYGWYQDGGKKMATGYLPTVFYPRSEDVSEGPFPLYRHPSPQPSETCPSLNGCGYCTEHGCPRAQPSEDEVEAVALYRHKKRGTVYEVIGEAELQCATHDPSEGDELVIYRGDDGKLWARMRDEFHDGRFEPIARLDAHRGKQACLKARETGQ